MKKVKLVRKPKRVSAWDVLELLWMEWVRLLISDEPIDTLMPKHYTLLDWGMEVIDEYYPQNFDDFVARMGIEKFGFERKIYHFPPLRETMVHMFGVHALLYDVWGCEEHKLTITTYDDERMITGSVPSCPMCNEKRMKKEFKDDFPLKVTMHNEESWEYLLREADFHRKNVKRSNWEHRLKNPRLTFWRLKDRIKQAIPVTLKIEEA